jgi:plasmid stabilization system protein ParE
MRELILTATATQHMEQALTWYADIGPALGKRFAQAVQHTFNRALNQPAQFKIAIPPFRRLLVPHFPYEIFYAYDDDKLVVYSVFHTAQDPAKWQENLIPPPAARS